VAGEVCDMTDSFGTRLRQQRELKRVTLASIAEQTKISHSLLEALERDDLSHWPIGIYRRSYIRTYARYVGLDPERVLREFLEAYPEPFDGMETMHRDADRGAERPPTRLRCLLRSLAGWLRGSGQPGADPDEMGQPSLARAAVRHAASADEASALDAVIQPPPAEPDLPAAAELCKEIGRVLEIGELPPLIERAAAILDAEGLVVWVWDAQRSELKPAVTHGYSDEMRARMPRVRRDGDNATAAALRTGQLQVVSSTDQATGALAAPLLTPGGCVGVLAVELRDGRERSESVRALTTMFAAQLATLTGSVPLARAVNA
jgi:transcriptional regulator with XRE-family HTH domain